LGEIEIETTNSAHLPLELKEEFDQGNIISPWSDPNSIPQNMRMGRLAVNA
jgi:hypothetical protein